MDNLFQYINKISSISETVFSELMSSVRKIELAKLDYFVREGEVSREIGFLEKGIVRAFYVNDAGKEFNKTLFSAPAFIGSYASIITGKPNMLPQQALTDCTVWKISVANLDSLSDKYCEIERLRRKMAEFFFLQNEKRELEMALLEAAERYLILRDEFPSIENQIPQYHIASYLGISPTQLSRIRNKIAK